MARKWTKTFYRGGSRLPKVITKVHMKPDIHNFMVLLHITKGSTDILVFGEWMFHYIDIILIGK